MGKDEGSLKTLVLSLAVLIGAGSVSQAGAAGKKKKRAPEQHRKSGISAEAGVRFVYDDNVHEYSPQDIAAFNGLNSASTAKDRAKFDRIGSIGDMIGRYKAGLFTQSNAFGAGFGTRLGAEGGYAQYSKNPIMSHPSGRFSLRQDLTDRHRLELSLEYEPGMFLRNYHGEISTAARFAGLHDTRAWEARWNGRFQNVPGLEVGARLGYETDRYRERELAYRDSQARRYGASLSYHWTKALKTALECQYETLSAARQPLSDISYIERKVVVKAEIKPLRKLDVDLGYTAHFKRYTSELGAADEFHSGRKDFRYDVTIKALYRVVKGVEFFAEYRRTEETSNLRKPVTTASAPDDFLRYRRNSFTAGVKARWD